MANYPEINGHDVSFCSITFDVDGDIFPLVKSLNYKEEMEIPKAYGTSDKPLARGRGQRKFSGDVEIYRKDWPRLQSKLSKNGKVHFSSTAWSVKVSYAEAAQGSEATVTDHLVGVRFHSPEFSNSEGVEISTVKLQMDFMDLELNKV